MTFHGKFIGTAKSRSEWLDRRRTGIGASDVAGILGLSPWSTPYSVWADKKHGMEKPRNEAMSWGSKLEDIIISELEEKTGLYVGCEQWLVAHPDYPWAMATPDGLLFESPVGSDVVGSDFDPLAIAEVKLDSSFSRWQDGPPDHYLTQVLWQMFVTGVERAVMGVLHGGRHFETYEVEFDADLAARIFTRVADWRDQFIVGDETPEVDGSDVTARTVRDLYADADEDRKIELSESMAADLEALKGWRAEADRVAKEVRRLETRIKASMQEATVGLVGGVEVVTWKPTTSRRIDTKRLKAERPDIYEKYAKPSTSRRFLVKKET